MKADCFHRLFTSVVVSSGDGLMVVFLWCFVVVIFLCGSAIALRSFVVVFLFPCFGMVFLFWCRGGVCTVILDCPCCTAAMSLVWVKFWCFFCGPGCVIAVSHRVASCYGCQHRLSLNKGVALCGVKSC